MEIILKDRIAAKLEEDLKQWHIERHEPDRYSEQGKRAPRPDVQVDLSKMSKEECQRFMELLDGCGIVGTKILAADIRKYLKAAETGNVEDMQARTVRQAAWMLEHFFAGLPHHIIFSHDAYGGKSHSGYYVADVDYEPAKKGDSREHAVPAKCMVKLVWMEDEHREVNSVSFSDEGCLGRTPREILTGLGYAPETPDLMTKLAKETERYYWAKELVGTQFVAAGMGVVDLDDASAKREIGWFTSFGRARKLKLDHFGVETRVVVDVLEEKDDVERRRGRDEGFDPYRWHSWNLKFFSQNEDEVAKHLEADEDTAERPDVEVPVHPLVPCFDLVRHLRMRIHVNNMEKYVYRRNVAENLILPDRDWRMVNLLVDQSRNTFRDVVAGKGASMNVLSEGPPGTGKTVTAEVFAEFKERPLYTVQCSQLGTTPGDVAANLAVVLARANRWNAILLLDEADVYIRKRGGDIDQNAIVGVFLRLLEYASCILFMTTNLADNVDDAVASRCIARLHYGPPTVGDQVKIWMVLSRLNSIPLTEEDARLFAERHPGISGRDVKNLLKLASFVAQSEGKPLAVETLEYVLQFKPTNGEGQ